jgi:hypothetical protein
MAKEAKSKEDSITTIEGNVDRTIVVYVQKVALTLHKFTCHEGLITKRRLKKNVSNNLFCSKQCLISQ